MRNQTTKSVTNSTVTLDESDIPEVTPHLYIKERDAPNVTFRQDKAPAAVVVALRGGATTIPEIAESAGLGDTVVKKALSRLVERGAVIKVARGRYASAEQANHWVS